MYVLGAGASTPDTRITNSLLADLSPEYSALTIRELTGIENRFSVLSSHYLTETGNEDPWKVVGGSNATPTDLSTKAAEMALSRAGITADKIGLIIGDCATPYETIPSEAQRVAKRLGIKVTSFDLLSSSAFLPLAFSTLAAWREERIPEYVLLVSACTATQRINYRKGSERLYFGDGASALVVSLKIPGPLVVRESSYRASGIGTQNFDIFAHGVRAPEYFGEVRAEEEMALQDILKKYSEKSSIHWIGTQTEPLGLFATAKSCGVADEHVWSNVAQCGDTLCAAPGLILSEHWSNLPKGERVVVTQAGMSSGHVVMEVLP